MKKGFTLVELLVVIAIIGVLAAAILVSLAGTRPKARDARRKRDLDTVRTTVNRYADANDDAVPPGDGTAPGTLLEASYTGLSGLLVPTYIGALPADPGTSPDHDYKYASFSSDGVTGNDTDPVRFSFSAWEEVTDTADGITVTQ